MIRSANNIICENRVYECLGCGFVGREQAANDHQTECDNPMKHLTERSESNE